MQISILTSGIGLGIYLPALFNQRALVARGVAAEVEVLEGYYTEAQQHRHDAHKQAYHARFELAQMAHRMARSVDGSLDIAAIAELLEHWRSEGRSHFIVWSGFWLPILERYRTWTNMPIWVDRCRIDAMVSASFRVHEDLFTDAPEIWLWNAVEQRTKFEIPVSEHVPVAFGDRDHRVVAHGGGWGLGTYRAAAAEMAATPWAFDVVVHARDEAPAIADNARPDDRYYMVDPTWRTWHRGPEGHRFPPFGVTDSPPARTNDHVLYQHIRRSKAIMSKPGGGTLIDSLSSATPVVLLEPYGYAEAANGELWQRLGFGVPYAAWRDTGFDEDVLRALHENLLRRPRGPDYIADYVARLAR